MKTFTGILFLLFAGLHVMASDRTRQAPWKQSFSCEVRAALSPDSMLVTGRISIRYTNHSPDTLKELYLNVWANAFRDNSTFFSRQMLLAGRTDHYYLRPAQRGYAALDSFVDLSNGTQIIPEFHPETEDVCKLVLRNGLLPGATVVISGKFRVKLPSFFLSGGRDSLLSAVHWYPAPAVYDANGWNLMPLMQGYGNDHETADTFRAVISVPSRWKLATGLTEDSSGERHSGIRSYYLSGLHVRGLTCFAFKGYTPVSRILSSGKGDSILFRIYHRQYADTSGLEEMMQYAAMSYSSHVNYMGIRPSGTFSLVLAGGTDMVLRDVFPGIAVCPEKNGVDAYRLMGIHCFSSQVHSLVRKHPWMSVSLQTFITEHLMSTDSVGDAAGFMADSGFYTRDKLRYFMEFQPYFLAYRQLEAQGLSMPVSTSSDSLESYAAVPVLKGKAALSFAWLNHVLGDTVFRECVRLYAAEWKNRHPLPHDMRSSFEKGSGMALDWFFDTLFGRPDDPDLMVRNGSLTDRKGIIPGVILAGKQPADLNRFGFLPETNYRNNIRRKQRIGFGIPFGMPAAGRISHLDVIPYMAYNQYDRWYAGLIIGHHLMHKRGPQFILIPGYSFSENKLTGYGHISAALRDADEKPLLRLGMKGQVFSISMASHMNRYYRIAPYLQADLGGRGNKRHNENLFELSFTRTGLLNRQYRINDSIEVNEPSSYFFHYIRTGFTHDNHDVINRYQLCWYAEGGMNHGFQPGKDRYVKTWMKATYRYRYAAGNKFFRTSFFAGVFLFDEGRTERQQFYLSANNGFTDYDYREPMPGRSELSSGNMLTGKQLLSNNGNMRNVIPLKAADRWMMALQNDISIPGIIPIGFYLDLGYYPALTILNTAAGTRKISEKPELIHTFGINLVLLKNTLEIFMPLTFSDRFKGYNNSTLYRTYNTIGFKLNLKKFDPDKLLRQRVLRSQRSCYDDI